MELIDREALIKDIEDRSTLPSDVWDTMGVLNIVYKQPTVEPPRGEWINAYPEIEPNPMFMYGICSQCGFEQSISDKLNFCPHCGARMKGE